MANEKSAAKVKVRTKTTWKSALKRDWQLYLLLLVPVALVVIFNYAAYPGLRMAFMNYKPAKGYAGSEWVGFETSHRAFLKNHWRGVEFLEHFSMGGPEEF